MADAPKYHYTHSDREMSLSEVAERLGTTKQHVHRIEQRALTKLRAALKDVDNPATNPMHPGCTQAQKR